MSRNYNFIYSHLVNGENDIVGHIAYSLYKSEKIAFIERFKEENNGKEPDENDLKPFHDSTCIPNRLSGYHLQASVLLKDFIDYTVAATLQEAENEVRKNYMDNMRTIFDEKTSKIKPKGFFHGVFQSIVGAICFALLVSVFLFFLTFSKQRYTFSIGGNGSVELTSKVDSTEKQ